MSWSLNLNDVSSVGDGILRTEEEIKMLDKGGWPVGAWSWDENRKARYRETLVVQRKVLIGRYLEMGAEPSWPADGYRY